MSDSTTAAYTCMPRPRLLDGSFAVEAVRPEHIERIRQWRNEQMTVLRQSEAITPERQEAYFAERVWPELQSRHPSNILLAIQEDGRLVGYGGLVHIAWEHRRAEVSFLLEPGRAQEAEPYERCFSAFLRLVQALAFEDLDLRRLFTETYGFRTKHMEILESVGFRREGVLLQHVWIEGHPVDSVIHGMVCAPEV